MKARITPLFFASRDEGFATQLEHLRRLFSDDIELLPETPLGNELPSGTDAVVFPQLLGEAYRRVRELSEIPVPILVITSEFGTLSMWDWEIIEFLRHHGVKTLAPYDEADARVAFRAMQTKARLARGTFLMYQDNPGVGQQASIFKRFWWWEEECRQVLAERLGVTVVYKSYENLGQRLATVSDHDAWQEWERWNYPAEGLSRSALLAAAKLYLAVARDIKEIDGVIGVGINCLNESHFSTTTPCMAWSRLFDDHGIMWACEADIVSLATKYVLHGSLRAPVVMSNIYPFLMGMAALKHERIPHFPEIVDEPENHILVGHCGYFALAPKSFCSQWCLRPSVLGMVNENSHMMDARLATGPITMAKIGPYYQNIHVFPGTLKGYVQYPGSDCRNGGVIRVPDGHQLMRNVSSHHQCIIAGDYSNQIRMVADVLAMEFRGYQ